MILYETSRIENFSISLSLSRGCSAVLCIAFFQVFTGSLIGSLYTPLPSLHDYDLKMRNFTFCGGRKQATTKVSFYF